MKRRTFTTILTALTAYCLIFAAACGSGDRPEEKVAGEENLPYEINQIYIAAVNTAPVSTHGTVNAGFSSFIRL